MIFAVGCIDGGYDGIPMNDNWLGFFIFTAVGLFFGVLKYPHLGLSCHIKGAMAVINRLTSRCCKD